MVNEAHDHNSLLNLLVNFKKVIFYFNVSDETTSLANNFGLFQIPLFECVEELTHVLSICAEAAEDKLEARPLED